MENHDYLPYDILNWFKSYLLGCTQLFQLKCSKSNLFALTLGVPQGPVLGPLFL